MAYPLTRNAAKCLRCGDVIESKRRHDFVSCSCGNVSVDGGLYYARRGFKSDEWEELSIELSLDTEEQYQWAMKEVEGLIPSDPQLGTEAGDRLASLATLVEVYEKKYFPL